MQGRGQKAFFYKEPDSKYLGMADHIVSVATNELYSCSMKVAIDNMN